MADVDIQTALDWRGRTVVDAAGEKIGTLKEIYLDQDERPSWGSVHTGLFGLRETLVPLAEAREDGDTLRVPFDRDHVKAAPNVDPDVQLDADEEDRLHRHYGIGDGDREVPAEAAAQEPSEAGSGTGAVAAGSGDEGETQGGQEQPQRAESTDDVLEPPAEQRGRGGTAETDDAMTRSEEEVHLGKRVRERGRVRLKKYVVTDHVETKVPVRREEVRVERDPPDQQDTE
jgi:stress response protein YsnF